MKLFTKGFPKQNKAHVTRYKLHILWYRDVQITQQARDAVWRHCVTPAAKRSQAVHWMRSPGLVQWFHSLVVPTYNVGAMCRKNTLITPDKKQPCTRSAIMASLACPKQQPSRTLLCAKPENSEKRSSLQCRNDWAGYCVDVHLRGSTVHMAHPASSSTVAVLARIQLKQAKEMCVNLVLWKIHGSPWPWVSIQWLWTVTLTGKDPFWPCPKSQL